MSESEFRHRIGSPNNDCPLPNIQMIIFENNYGNNHSNVNKRFAGMAATEFPLGFPVAFEPAYRRAVRHHSACSHLAVRGHG